MSPETTLCQPPKSLSRSRLGRISSQSASVASEGSRSRTMEQARVDQFDVMRVEVCRRPAKMREVESFGELVEGQRLDGLRRADAGEYVEHGQRFDAFLAQMLDSVRPQPL